MGTGGVFIHCMGSGVLFAMEECQIFGKSFVFYGNGAVCVGVDIFGTFVESRRCPVGIEVFVCAEMGAIIGFEGDLDGI